MHLWSYEKQQTFLIPTIDHRLVPVRAWSQICPMGIFCTEKQVLCELQTHWNWYWTETGEIIPDITCMRRIAIWNKARTAHECNVCVHKCSRPHIRWRLLRICCHLVAAWNPSRSRDSQSWNRRPLVYAANISPLMHCNKGFRAQVI